MLIVKPGHCFFLVGHTFAYTHYLWLYSGKRRKQAAGQGEDGDGHEEGDDVRSAFSRTSLPVDVSSPSLTDHTPQSSHPYNPHTLIYLPSGGRGPGGRCGHRGGSRDHRGLDRHPQRIDSGKCGRVCCCQPPTPLRSPPYLCAPPHTHRSAAGCRAPYGRSGAERATSPRCSRRTSWRCCTRPAPRTRPGVCTRPGVKGVDDARCERCGQCQVVYTRERGGERACGNGNDECSLNLGS